MQSCGALIFSLAAFYSQCRRVVSESNQDLVIRIYRRDPCKELSARSSGISSDVASDTCAQAFDALGKVAGKQTNCRNAFYPKCRYVTKKDKLMSCSCTNKTRFTSVWLTQWIGFNNIEPFNYCAENYFRLVTTTRKKQPYQAPNFGRSLIPEPTSPDDFEMPLKPSQPYRPNNSPKNRKPKASSKKPPKIPK